MLWSFENTFCAQTKQKCMTLFNNFFSSLSVFAMCSWEYHNACMFWCRTHMHCALFASRGMHTRVLCYSHKHTSKTDTEDKKSLNKVIIFVFFVNKMYSRCFVKLRLNHWCHMEYYNNVPATCLGLEHVTCVAVDAESESCCVAKMNESLTVLE